MTQPGDQQNQSQQPHSDLGNELRELGQQIEQAVRSAMESDRAKQVQADIASGMKEIGAQLQNAVKAMQDNPNVQNLVQRGEQAVGQAQQSKFAQDLQETLARGIAALNEQLSGFVNRVNQSTAADAASADTSASGDADTGASTGETTRLDPDKQ
jgi:heparin binding hemagglutinin HbhA